MPVVIIKASGDFYPDETRDFIPPEAERTLSLAEQMPDFVVAASKERFNQELTSKEVLVDIERFHSSAKNAPDIWLVVMPMHKPSREPHMEMFHLDIVTSILLWARQTGGGRRMSIDCDAWFSFGRGCNIKADGQRVGVTVEW